MGFQEPCRFLLGKTVRSALALFVALQFSALASAEQSGPSDLFQISTGFRGISQNDIGNLLKNAQSALNMVGRGESVNDGSISFVAEGVLGDPWLATVKFKQVYRGVEVFGNHGFVHYRAGNVADVVRRSLTISVNPRPSMSELDAYRIVLDHYQTKFKLSYKPKLKIYRDPMGQAYLVYQMATRSVPGHDGKNILLDAHTGQPVLIYPRSIDERIFPNGRGGISYGGRGPLNIHRLSALNYNGARMTVYTADTDEAKKHVDNDGFPTDIELGWYEKVIEDGNRDSKADASADRAYANTGLTYAYYKEKFKRLSYDDKDSRLTSVVHMGLKMNNAFWTDEFRMMAYGDGDGDHLIDLTNGLDVAAHEITHAVTSSTSNLVYVGEPGALNESYSDFFGKMVAWKQGNWYIGDTVVSPSWGRKALRNMLEPEEFKQPGSMTSRYHKPTTGKCGEKNDHCGVHTNSGIPNRAAALIVESIGKEKTERIYFKVLTEGLSENASFRDARLATEAECARQLGKDSADCRAVTAAFDATKM